MENHLSLYKRLYIYQRERFPVVAHGLMITAFTFSAISYSRICRGLEGFISIQNFMIGIFTSFTFFLLLRIFDEFKDKEEDAQFRTYLPVPRGLVTLRELKYLGWVVALLQLTVIAAFQSQMLGLYFIIIAYLLLMSKEFFVADWLKQRQLLYIISHMMIIPLIDLYSSGLDWELSGGSMHLGIAWFMLVSFINGLVLEFGRKIRTKDSEEEGVISYTKLYGTRPAVWIWLGLLSSTLLAAIAAVYYAGYSHGPVVVLMTFYVVSIVPALSFIMQPTDRKAKFIEYASGIWTALMYLSLGAIPMIKNLVA